MTKVLFPIYPWSNAGFPADRIQGGLFASVQHQVKAMVHAGFDVTLLTSKNFPVTDSRVKQIACDFLSKEEIGTIKWLDFTRAIAKHGNEFDVVWLNFPEIKLDKKEIRGEFEKFASRIIMLLHHYDETPFSTFFVTQYQVMAWVLKQGGRVATVSKTFNNSVNKRFEQKPDCITRNPYHCPDLPTDKVKGFEWFNIMVTEDSFTKGNLESNGDFVALGRCSEEKKLDIAVRAFVDSGVDSKLHVFTNEPTLEPKQTRYYEKLKSYDADNVIWHINESREQIFDNLRKSSIFIFPSSKETFGLSAFEAASCGCRVIYGCPNSWFLDDYDVKVNNYRVPTFVKVVQGSVAPSLEDKENRRKHFENIGSFEMFADRIKQFISGNRSYV